MIFGFAWLGNGFSWLHSLNINSVSKSARTYSTSWIERPVCEAFSFTKNGKPAIITFISRLLFCGYPSAITWEIPFIRVYSIDLKFFRISRRFGPFSESVEISPRLADFYTFSPVQMVGLVIFIGAALQHSVPYPVESIALIFFIVTMFRISLFKLPYFFTPAGSGVREQFKCPDIPLSPAATFARIKDKIILSAFLTNKITSDNPFTKAVPDFNRQRFGCHLETPREVTLINNIKARMRTEIVPLLQKISLNMVLT